MKYSIDTSALVDWWVRYYPPETFKTLVPLVEALIAAGDLRASREVLDELEKQDDDLYKWAKSQPDLFIEDGEDVQDAVATLMGKYFNEAKPEKGISGADPFVIGLAMTAKEGPATVVTGEKPGTKENPKIPFVCGVEKVLDCTLTVRQRNQGQVAISAVWGRCAAAPNGGKFASNSAGGR